MQTKSNQTFWTVSKETEAKLSPQLPLIIWGDKHNSTLHYSSLLSLLPYLTERGYANFGLEYDNSLDLEGVINRIKINIQNAYKCKKILEDNKKFLLYDVGQQKNIQIAVERIPVFKKKLKFLEQIKELG